jgi:glycosyltransferase involved in cell wall biosynthesis
MAGEPADMTVRSPDTVREASKPTALFLTRNLITGGAERVFVNYVNHAQAIRPAVALLERRGELIRELRSDIPLFARVERTPSIATEIPGEVFVRLLPECWWLRGVARRSDARVISSFLMRAHIVALLTKIVLLPRMPVVLNIHEHMSESAPFLYPLRRDRTLMEWVTRHLFRRADRIIVVAEELKRDLVESFGLPASMIHVAYNPLDVSRIRDAASQPLGERMSAETIVAVGRLVHLKGYDLLLRAVAQLRRTRDVKLVLVGEGELRPKLEALVANLGLQQAVTFAGHRENPWRYMARANVLALTSRTEAFPSVLTEALALGVPVLATDCSAGIRECLGDGACGLIVPREDVDAIARGLDRLLSDPSLRTSLIAAGRAQAERFDIPVAQPRYESLVLDVIKARTA